MSAYDGRENNNFATAGLYQSLIYHVGLSGGAWLIGSLVGNNYPTVSTLRPMWETTLNNSVFYPGGFNSLQDSSLRIDLDAKAIAGFSPTLTDPWGRLLSLQLLQAPDGGVNTRLSDVTNHMAAAFDGPYPIFVGINVDPSVCSPTDADKIFEITPYEFGSWDSGISAFTQTAYLGSPLENGLATLGYCVENYDNLGYIMGTSSNLFEHGCLFPSYNIPQPAQPFNDATAEAGLFGILSEIHNSTYRDRYAAYPNPFYGYQGSPAVESQTELLLFDASVGGQNNPLWPLLQPARAAFVDVVIVNDFSADTFDNLPNGTQLHNTYTLAQRANLTRMPPIPDSATFVSRGLLGHATFFGCNINNTLTIIYLPNSIYSYKGEMFESRTTVFTNETIALIANGALVATQNADPEWPTCLGCAIVMKTGEVLPDACAACFTKYCVN